MMAHAVRIFSEGFAVNIAKYITHISFSDSLLSGQVHPKDLTIYSNLNLL